MAAVAFTLLAGCSSPANPSRLNGLPALPDVHLPPHPVTLSVRDAHIEAGRCPDGVTDFHEECHVVRLHMDNPNNVTVETTLAWSAADAQGGGVPFGDLAGPSSVGANSGSDLTVRFTTPGGAPHLTRIVFDGFPTARGEADVPPY